MMMEWISYNLESQEFSFGNMTAQRLLIISDFGCSVYQMPPASKTSNQLRLDTKATKLQYVLSFSYLYQSFPCCCWVLFSSYSNTCMGGKCASQMTAGKQAAKESMTAGLSQHSLLCDVLSSCVWSLEANHIPKITHTD